MLPPATHTALASPTPRPGGDRKRNSSGERLIKKMEGGKDLMRENVLGGGRRSIEGRAGAEAEQVFLLAGVMMAVSRIFVRRLPLSAAAVAVVPALCGVAGRLCLWQRATIRAGLGALRLR